MASFLKRLFSSGQKRDTTFQGPRPKGSLQDTPIGADVNTLLRQRIAGENVGFGDDFAGRHSSPIIANLRNRFESREIPELQAELTRTGRRGGSGGFDQIKRARQEQGLVEGDVFANLSLQNELQKRNEIGQALSAGQQFAGTEAQLSDNVARFELGLHNDQLKREDARRKFVDEQRLKGIDTALTLTGQGFAGGNPFQSSSNNILLRSG